jgi:hypothetical protein
MASSRHVGAITELNLSTCQSNTLVDRINAVPGLKTSAGKLWCFFLFFFLPFCTLRHIHASFTIFENRRVCFKPENCKGGSGLWGANINANNPPLHQVTSSKLKL